MINPYRHVFPVPMRDPQGGIYFTPYLPIGYALENFREYYPNGEIRCQILKESADRCVVETRVYTDAADEVAELVRRGEAKRDGAKNVDFFAIATLRSMSNALIRMGFGAPLDAEFRIKWPLLDPWLTNIFIKDKADMLLEVDAPLLTLDGELSGG